MKRNGIPEDKHLDYQEYADSLVNLQLLEGTQNIEKSDKEPVAWLNEKFETSQEKRDYMRKNYIPQDVELDFENFLEFCDKRRNLIAEKLNEILK